MASGGGSTAARQRSRCRSLPADLWALILRHGKVEREQSRAWVEWADRLLMQLVAIWFRTGGQRKSKWLGTLMGKNGGVSYASTDAMEDRFRPWCNAILRPGEDNSPLHFAGVRKEHPQRFVDVYVHMLSMMNYVGFHDVVGRLKRILRTFARCLQPGSDVPKYIPGPPDSEDEDRHMDRGGAGAGRAAAAADGEVRDAGLRERRGTTITANPMSTAGKL